ncbi:MAG: neutral/alkaline non-lysosomal ceramidase N-terminal domain-containing protein [Elusimicrobia bacterium]|nr:neutral/alkaline non-lysosomal ceramidase N-terminal domain-containing protein [Elusimicrobiota bacterium]
MKVGVSKIVITPPVGVDLWGYGYYINRRSVAVHDDLFAKAVLFDDGKNRSMIIVCDLGALGEDSIRECKNEIVKSVNIKKENICICTTHTHAGPVTVNTRAIGTLDENYLKDLKKNIIESAKRAESDLEDVRIGAAKGEIDIGYNRVIENGPKDNELFVMRIDKTSGGTKAVIYNYNAHPVNSGSNNFLISSDWPGQANQNIEKEIGCIPVFLQGYCGDINVKDDGNFEKAKEYGKDISDELLKVYKNIKVKDGLKIDMKSAIINLPLHVPTIEEVDERMEKYSDWRKKDVNFERFMQEWKEEIMNKVKNNSSNLLPVEIQILKVGKDIVFAIQPSELFTKVGMKIKKIVRDKGFKNVFVVGYANDYVGYIPDEEDFGDGPGRFRNYAAMRAPMFTGFFRYEKNVGAVLVDGLKSLLESL